jgi:hypothetical protein
MGREENRPNLHATTRRGSLLFSSNSIHHSQRKRISKFKKEKEIGHVLLSYFGSEAAGEVVQVWI